MKEAFIFPDGICKLETQVAGHVFNYVDLGLIKDAESGCVLKSIGRQFCGERELNFYLALKITTGNFFDDLKSLVPLFYEVVHFTILTKEQPFLKLENITMFMHQPCVMDIKIGKRTWDPLSTPKKRFKEEQKYTECKRTLGLCVPGFQLYSLNSNKLLRYGKDFGKQLNPDRIQAIFEYFFNTSTGVYSPLLLQVLYKLYQIRNWFNMQRTMKFYASSVLIAYDCHVLSMKKNNLDGKNNVFNFQCGNEIISKKELSEYTCKCDLEDFVEPEQWVQVKMIDFAHVFRIEDGCIDANYTFGLQNLISIIEKLYQK